MSREPKETLSRDHAMEREGVAWESSVAAEDVFPYMPKEEYEFRIQKAKTLLARHGIDTVASDTRKNGEVSSGNQFVADGPLEDVADAVDLLVGPRAEVHRPRFEHRAGGVELGDVDGDRRVGAVDAAPDIRS